MVAFQSAFEMCGECDPEFEEDCRTGRCGTCADSGRWRPEQTLLCLFAFFRLNDTKMHVARGGYTDEDGIGVRLFVSFCLQLSRRTPGLHSAAQTDLIASALVTGPVQWDGLGARDGLRLEASTCLYGNDLDETINWSH